MLGGRWERWEVGGLARQQLTPTAICHWHRWMQQQGRWSVRNAGKNSFDPLHSRTLTTRFCNFFRMDADVSTIMKTRWNYLARQSTWRYCWQYFGGECYLPTWVMPTAASALGASMFSTGIGRPIGQRTERARNRGLFKIPNTCQSIILLFLYSRETIFLYNTLIVRFFRLIFGVLPEKTQVTLEGRMYRYIINLTEKSKEK